MLDTVLGLPTHPLLVHGSVVLIPLTALLAAYVAWRPRTWRRSALPLTVLALVMTGLAFATTQAGERLEERLAESELIEAHAEIGELVPLLAIALLVCAAAMWLLRRRGADDATRDAGSTAGPTAAQRVVAIVTSLVAIAVIVWTIRAGHTGAEAVWKPIMDATQP